MGLPGLEYRRLLNGMKVSRYSTFSLFCLDTTKNVRDLSDAKLSNVLDAKVKRTLG